jgi:hypothetical protein
MYCDVVGWKEWPIYTHHVALDVKSGQISDDVFGILALLLGRIGVVEADDQTSLIPVGVVLV